MPTLLFCLQDLIPGSTLDGEDNHSSEGDEMSNAEKMLREAGFKIVYAYPRARWFEVVAPDGEEGAVLCQSPASWHFFAKNTGGCASSCMVENCHRGGLGDAIGNEREVKIYNRLMSDSIVPSRLRKWDSVYRVMTVVYNNGN